MCYFADLFGKIGRFFLLKLCARLVFLQVLMRLTCNIEALCVINRSILTLDVRIAHSILSALHLSFGRRLSCTLAAHAFFGNNIFVSQKSNELKSLFAEKAFDSAV